MQNSDFHRDELLSAIAQLNREANLVTAIGMLFAGLKGYYTSADMTWIMRLFEGAPLIFGVLIIHLLYQLRIDRLRSDLRRLA